MILNKIYSITLLLLLPIQSCCKTNKEQAENQQEKKLLYQKKGISLTTKNIFTGIAVFALLYWLIEKNKPKKHTIIKNKTPNASIVKKFLNENTEIEKIKNIESKYNKDRFEMYTDLKIYFEYKFESINLTSYLKSNKKQRGLSLHNILQNISESNVYYATNKITLEEMEKIKLCCLFTHFANQSDDYCQKIAGLNTQDYQQDHNFYQNRDKVLIPGVDEIFEHIKNYLDVDKKNNKVQFGDTSKTWNFQIDTIDDINNIIVYRLTDETKEKSIHQTMLAIYFSLYKKNTEFLKDTLIPHLKKLLENGYDLSDTTRFYWFYIFIFHINKHDQDSFKDLLRILDCFYPTEFLLSKECLTANSMIAFCKIDYKMWGCLNNYENIKPSFNDDEMDLEILYHVISCGEQINFSNEILFDKIFTKENLQQPWLQKFLKKAGTANADVIWSLLLKKSKTERNAIINIIPDESLKNTLTFFEENNAENKSSSLSINFEDSSEVVNQLNLLFFTSDTEFSQLFYSLMKNKNNFTMYMNRIFESNIFDENQNQFINFVKYRFINKDENCLKYIDNNKNNKTFLRDTSSGMVMSNNDYLNQKNLNAKALKSFFNKYYVTQKNSLLLLRWYEILCAIALNENTNQEKIECYNNKEYLSEIFKNNLSHYKIHFTNPDLNINFKQEILCENSEIMNVASAYHLLEYAKEHLLYNNEKQKRFLNKNKYLTDDQHEMINFMKTNVFGIL